MTRATVGELEAIAPIAQREVRRWALHLQATERLAPERAVARLPEEVHPYVALSREAGAGGGELGRSIAERLGGQCLDTQLLTYMAERYGLPEGVLDLVDETASSWLHETFRLWLDRRAITQDEYVMPPRSARPPGGAAGHGRLRRAGYPVPPPARTGAGRPRHRPARAAGPAHRGAAGARPRGRRHFHRDATDSHLYDLVVNLESLDRGQTADLVAEAFRWPFDTRAKSR